MQALTQIVKQNDPNKIVQNHRGKIIPSLRKKFQEKLNQILNNS